MTKNSKRKKMMAAGDRVPENHNTRPYSGNESLTNVESLPYDLFFNIILLLPSQDIYNLRLVCRKWYHMIRSHNFIYAHLLCSTSGLLIQDYSESQHPLLLATKQGRIVISEFDYNFRDNVFATCNGLVLEKGMQNEAALYIANPVTKQQWVLPFFRGMPRLGDYGMGYAAASMEYKVVVTYDSQDIGSTARRCAILTAGVDNSWRHVDIHHLSYTAKSQLGDRTPLITEGFLHWYRYGTHVLTLNMETEIITETPVPHVLVVVKEKYFLSAGKHLSLIIPCSGLSWEVWEMKPETGEWTKLRNIELGALKQIGYGDYRSLIPVCWLSYPEVLVFDSLNPIRACVAYNVRTKEVDSFRLASFGRLYIFKAHRNSLVRLGG